MTGSVEGVKAVTNVSVKEMIQRFNLGEETLDFAKWKTFLP